MGSVGAQTLLRQHFSGTGLYGYGSHTFKMFGIAWPLFQFSEVDLFPVVVFPLPVPVVTAENSSPVV
jgi:hypothetical protein